MNTTTNTGKNKKQRLAVMAANHGKWVIAANRYVSVPRCECSRCSMGGAS